MNTITKIIASCLVVLASSGICYGVSRIGVSLAEKETVTPSPSPAPDIPSNPDSPLTHTVTFSVDGETTTQTVSTGGFVQTPQTPVKEGYIFKGWYIGDILIEDLSTYPIIEDVTFTAMFEINAYTITVNIDGEETTQTINYGETLTLETPTKEGYTFKGWSIDGETLIDISTYQIIENTTITAVFEEIIKDYIPSSASLFTFEGNTLTGYIGEETDIVIPKTYSIGEIVTQTKEFLDFYELIDFVEQNSSLTMNLVDSNELTLEAITIDTLFENHDYISFPVEISYQVKTYIDGIDYQVTSIAENAFYQNTTLTNLVILDNVTSIGKNAVRSCDNLLSVVIGQNVESIGTLAFADCKILESIKVDRNNVVFNDGNRSNVIIETSTNILIQGCNKSTIPDSVTSIGDRAFQNCKTLTSISIPNSVTSLGYGVFLSCDGLTSVIIGDNVESLSSNVFYGCKNLSNVVIGKNVKSISSSAFEVCKSLKNLVIPDSVTHIGSNAFYSCSALSNITIGNGCTNIDANAFMHCIGLTNVTIPESVTSIARRAFYGCTNLKVVTINSGANMTMAEEVFKSANSIEQVIFTSTTTPNFTSDFIPTTTCLVYVDDTLVETYKANEYLISHADQIHAISELEE